MPEPGNHVGELIAPYVLGALEPEEVEAVEVHLLTCAECRAEVDAERAVVGLLPYLAEPRPVPQRARAELLARIERAPVPLAARRRRVPAALTRLGWVAAIAAALTSGILAWNGQQMQAQVAQKDRELSAAKQSQNMVAEFTSSGRGFVMTLQSTGVAPGAEGGVIIDPTRNAALLAVNGLPKLPPGHAFVVWLIRGNEHLNAGVLPVNDQGSALLYISQPQALATFDGILITEESGALAQNPTGIRMMSGKVGQ